MSGIIDYYGLLNCNTMTLHHAQFDNDVQIEENSTISALAQFMCDKYITLFLAIRAATIYDRITHLPILVEQRFGLQSELLAETQIKQFDYVLRLGAYEVDYKQISLLLMILRNCTCNAFAVVFNDKQQTNYLTTLLHLFENGVLTPKVLGTLSVAVADIGGSFLHILQGNDGYSINYFQNQRI